MRSLLLIGLALATGCQHSAQADQSTAPVAPIECEHVPGFADGPYVGDQVAARQVAAAVIQSLERRHGMDSRARDREYVLNIEDDGREWIAFQSVRGYSRREGDAIVVMMGGGGLEMRIDKCDGAISQLHWSR
jgi:hypothetical protein